MPVLSPRLYHLAQVVAIQGVEQRYLPARARALDWDAIPELSILEIGAGATAFPARGIATDIELARMRHQLDLGRPALVADGRRLPFGDASFGRVYCEGVLHHVPDFAATEIVSDMARVCAPGGRIVVMDSVWPRSPFRIAAWGMRAVDMGRHVRTEAHLLRVLEAATATIREFERISYSALGLECLLTVLEPTAEPLGPQAPAGPRERSVKMPPAILGPGGNRAANSRMETRVGENNRSND